MLLLGSAHIGEVQASVWDAATREAAPRQASRCCKQVFHTKIQKAGYHPHGDTLPLFVFCLYPGRIVRVLYHHQTKNPQTKGLGTRGGRYRTRTCDLLHVKQMLYQLS